MSVLLVQSAQLCPMQIHQGAESASWHWWARQDSNLQPDRYEREGIVRYH
jgi:hypothetical protein